MYGDSGFSEERAAFRAAIAALRQPVADTDLLNMIASEYLSVEPFDMPTGQGDADVGWRVFQYQGRDRKMLSEVFHDNLREAIESALATQQESRND